MALRIKFVDGCFDHREQHLRSRGCLSTTSKGSEPDGCSVGIALLTTGVVVGLLSGGPPFKRALRQLAIGYGAAGATYLLGMLFGTSL